MRNVESVWDYPRPPRLEIVASRLRVVHGGVTLADSARGLRVLETSHPPVYYLPPRDIRMDLLAASAQRRSFCEFKGLATYWDLQAPPGPEDTSRGTVVVAPAVAWSYPEPAPQYAPLAGHLAFYAGRVDECWVGDERVLPQAGDFYGGWITSNVRGPFKGGPGTRGW